MNHLDFDPGGCTRGELYDAYRDMQRIAGDLSTENCLLYRRQGQLEAWISAQVEATMDRMHAKCLLGECQPQWEPLRRRYVHMEPCRMAAAEELLRERMDPYDSPVYRRAHSGRGQEASA